MLLVVKQSHIDVLINKIIFISKYTEIVKTNDSYFIKENNNEIDNKLKVNNNEIDNKLKVN